MSNHNTANSLTAGHGRTGSGGSKKDDILTMKFVMDRPGPPVYPLDDKLDPKIYPDYCPWQDDDTENDKLKNSGYLNKGYFENPLVSNEYYSARNLVQETLFLSTNNYTTILKELSQHFTQAYKTRNEVINKIKYESNNFKIPPRVTLTAAKKEAWLKDLANPEIPLQTVSSRLPHGIRNKVLIDCMCNMKVPLSRAIWFTKCSLYSELLVLQKKFNSKQSTLSANNPISFPALEVFEKRWLQEWTQQVSDYIFKFSKGLGSVNSTEKQVQVNSKLNYLLSYMHALYVEDLLDKDHFLSSIIKFLRDDLPFEHNDIPKLLELTRSEVGEDGSILEELIKDRPVNIGQILIGHTLIRTFWRDIIAEDFLSKFVSESLLLTYFLIERLPMQPKKHHDQPQVATLFPQNLKQDLLNQLGKSISMLFKHNTNLFIFPNYWMLVSDTLLKVLLSNQTIASDLPEKLHKVLQLLNYRNESLMLNMQYLSLTDLPMNLGNSLRRNSFMASEGPLHKAAGNDVMADENQLFTNRSPDDNLRFIEQLDRLKLNNALALRLRPNYSNSFESTAWRKKIKILVYWCVSVHRHMGMSSEKILILCNFLKRKVLQAAGPKGANQLKAEFENELLESIFSLAEEPKKNVEVYNLYVLINELYQLKIISISSYVRKLIACGIFYNTPQITSGESQLPQSDHIQFHLCILKNLPVLNNKQCDHILKRWTPDGFNFSKYFSRGVALLQSNILDRLLNNSFCSSFSSELDEIKSFNVGVKFLLVNWLTTQFKVTINGAPKLVHLSPNIVAHIYHFYSITDNLTVFFKVFVKFVLRNENKIIIYYLETLYYICKLIMHHYTLVKFISGATYESVSTAYELFKLMIINYKDLLSRETDLYQFNEVWNFINASMEKVFDSEKQQDPDPKMQFNKSLYEKETADSPLKVLMQNQRLNEVYSIEQFKNDLSNLMLVTESLLSAEELNDIVNEIQPRNDHFTTDFDNTVKHEAQIIILLDEWYGRLYDLAENQELALFKLVESTRRTMKISTPRSFETQVQTFIKQKMENNSSVETLYILLQKLVTFELFSLFDLVSMLKNLSMESNCNIKEIGPLITDLTLGDAPQKNLPCYQYLIIKEIQHEYQMRHVKDIISYTLDQHLPLSIFKQREIRTKHETKIISIVRDGLLFHQRWTMMFLADRLSEDQLLPLFNQMLTFSMSLLNDTDNLARSTNEFTLAVVQALLSFMARAQLDGNNFGKIIAPAIKLFHFLFGPSNSFFGEMFNCLNWSTKLQIFHYMEHVFLTQTAFYLDWGVEDIMAQENVHPVSLWKNIEGDELIPAFKDYFKKFSLSSAEKIATTIEEFRRLEQFLLKLLNVLDNDDVAQQDDSYVYDVVSIFLKLLIIRKATLTMVVVEHDATHFTFLKNLVSMLNTRYFMNGHEKLKILLYDLLLLMKSSLTEQLRLGTNESIIGNTQMGPSQLILLSGSNGEDRKGQGENPDAPDLAADALTRVSDILNLPEPASENPFGELAIEEDDSAFGLDEEELDYGSDVGYINNSGLVLTSTRSDSIGFSTAFGVLQQDAPIQRFNIKGMNLIEDTSTELNDGCINLSLFDAYTIRENPP